MLGELRWAVSDWVRQIPRTWRLVGALALLAIVVVGIVGIGGSSDTTADPGASAERAGAPGTTGTPGGVPEGATMLRRDGQAVLGVLRTDDGAAAAALSYTAQRNALQTGGTSAAVAAEVGSKLAIGGHDIGRRPASIPDRAGDQNAQAMLATRQGTLTWRTLPVAYRVRSYSNARAVVRVFSAALSAWKGPQGAAFGFSLRDMTLDWKDGAWRIRAVDDTPDQPAPGFTVGLNSDRASRQQPIEDRLLKAQGKDTTGLADWLSTSQPVTAGPDGMGPVAGNVPATADLNIVSELQRGYRETNQQHRNPTGKRWVSTVPLGYRAARCTEEVIDLQENSGGVRCYEVLTAATRIDGRGIAITALELDGFGVAPKPGLSGSISYDLPEGRQMEVLGAPVRIASGGAPDSKTTNAAWRRSVLPLSPVVPGGPR